MTIYFLMSRLVDSRNITELQLKQSDCELVIRKKETLQPPESASPIVMPHYMPQAMFQTPPPVAPIASPAASPATPAPAHLSLPPAKTSNSSHLSLNAPWQEPSIGVLRQVNHHLSRWEIKCRKVKLCASSRQ